MKTPDRAHRMFEYATQPLIILGIGVATKAAFDVRTNTKRIEEVLLLCEQLLRKVEHRGWVLEHEHQ